MGLCMLLRVSEKKKGKKTYGNLVVMCRIDKKGGRGGGKSVLGRIVELSRGVRGKAHVERYLDISCFGKLNVECGR